MRAAFNEGPLCKFLPPRFSNTNKFQLIIITGYTISTYKISPGVHFDLPPLAAFSGFRFSVHVQIS